MALKIFPYQMTSESAKDIADLLGILRIKQEGSYIPKHTDKIINWGNSRTPSWYSRAQSRSVTILNKFDAVNTAANKLLAFQRMSEAGIRIPQFTTSMSQATQWLNSGATVMERHTLRGNSGEGIRVVNLDDEEMESYITAAPLYTKYIPKSAEFRVHVFRGQVIDYVQKLKVSSDRRPENFNKYISSTSCGWVFSRTNIREMPEVIQQAITAVRALGLDFGAVDIVFADGLSYVLEVNTSPGLAGTTLVRYCNTLRRFMGLADLPQHVTDSILDRPTVVTPSAAHVASVTAGADLNGDVVLRLDRVTATKLRTLLSQQLGL